jgi:hypothetical protein
VLQQIKEMLVEQVALTVEQVVVELVGLELVEVVLLVEQV